MITLVVVSALVFAVSDILPGDVGRTILGPLAGPEQVAALNAELGYDRSVLARYASFLVDFVTLDWGRSPVLDAEIGPLVGTRLRNSMVLAAFALVIGLPLAFAAGIVAGLRQGRPVDRAVSILGLSFTAIPEFVTGIVLITTFSIRLRWLPVGADAPPGAGPAEHLRHLVLPAATIMLVLFGYLSRIVRAGTIEAARSDFVRTAILKGCPRRRVVRRHVLPNALLPVIGVVGAQLGYVIGGLVVVEALFNYDGLGSLLLRAAESRDVPLLATTTLVIAFITVLLSLCTDVLYALVNPRIRVTT